MENANPKFSLKFLNFVMRFEKRGITNCTIVATIKF